MINNIRFKIIAGEINKIPEFYTIFGRKMADYITRQRDWAQIFKAEAKSLRPKPKFWPRGYFGLEDLTSLIRVWPKQKYQSTEGGRGATQWLMTITISSLLTAGTCLMERSQLLLHTSTLIISLRFLIKQVVINYFNYAHCYTDLNNPVKTIT